MKNLEFLARSSPPAQTSDSLKSQFRFAATSRFDCTHAEVTEGIQVPF